MPVVCAGGVMSSDIIRAYVQRTQPDIYFRTWGRYSSDNAIGVAVLAAKEVQAWPMLMTVTALNRYVKTLLERDSVLRDVALRGEISNFTNHYKTGHFYFSLKDEQCSVKAVMFRRDAQNLAFMPQNGMRVIVRCRIYSVSSGTARFRSMSKVFQQLMIEMAFND